ncbi:hypothetical protein BS47DRAFT_1373118 [Hydnum rufescens UP504]|uniref:Programmed cell death protein 2 C-terminal domain-containing protein n=1 Tax=Hydnum rufescens UP504 TaxID=1448309 RepID=A0A9P6ASR5_9AGAM|nr:hypothetical protein BS47DRAFT_1373118 [Hydnum rufescens UP504]
MLPDDYSDSDESDLNQVQTSVLLGVPDGPISSPDLWKPRISRIGGPPVFLRGISVPPLSVSDCRACSHPMELLLQLWCPFEGSPYDRTLHIWGCSRVRCQRQPGSIRVIRVLRYNEKYAAKLAAPRSKTAEKQKPPLSQNASNPFSLFGNGFGDEPFVPGGIQQEVHVSGSDDPSSSENEDEDINPSTVSGIAAALLRTTLEASSPSPDRDWSSVPSHSPLYLDTVSEYIAPPGATIPKVNNPGVGQEVWGGESYEPTKGIDEVFEKFVLRVGQEPQQCIRYDPSGIPLPFSAESTYKRLFPLAHTLPPIPGTPIVVTGTSSLSHTLTTSAANEISTKRSYDPSILPQCEACGSPRVFECQIMPNLINVFHSSSSKNLAKAKKSQTDEERRAEVARVLQGGGVGKKGDMEWGTCLVFSCLADCCREKVGEGKIEWKEVKAGWKEEFVLVQWDV